MKNKHTEVGEIVDVFIEELIPKVQHFAGKGQYEKNSAEQKAYIDGVQTATAMMTIDLKGTHKSKGMLGKALTKAKEEQKQFDAYLIRTSGWHTAEKLARKLFGVSNVNWYTQKQMDGAREQAKEEERERIAHKVRLLKGEKGSLGIRGGRDEMISKMAVLAALTPKE